MFNKEEILDGYVELDAKILPNAFKMCSNQKNTKGKEKKETKAGVADLENYYRTEIVLNSGIGGNFKT